MTDPNRPLWQKMYDAATAAPQGSDDWSHCVRNVAAAELRAIAGWLVPEEPEPDPGDRAISLRWLERQRLRLALLAEAYRAEAGCDG